MKLYIKQKAFSPRSSAQRQPGGSSSVAAPIDSEFLPPDFLNRISCFETLRVYQGKIFLWREHFSRFGESCLGLGYAPPLTEPETKTWLNQCVEESGLADALLRIALHQTADGEQRLVVILRPFASYPEDWYSKGVEAATSSVRKEPLKAHNAQLKLSQYVNGVLASVDMGERRPHEIIFLGSGQTVAEGSISNLFIVNQNVVLTPKVASGILKGVTREFVIQLVKKTGLELKETFLTRHELYTAAECFMTNTSSEVLPVVKIDGRAIGEGVPGNISRNLRKIFHEQMKAGL